MQRAKSTILGTIPPLFTVLSSKRQSDKETIEMHNSGDPNIGFLLAGFCVDSE